MIFFTADTHYLRDNIIHYSSRPFKNSDEMTERLISNWNERVKPGDQVYHLGDFAISYGKRDQEAIDSILSKLNGQKHLVRGNHDRSEVVKNPRWASVDYYMELKLDLGDTHRQRICLFHYSLRTWSQMHRGSWMLHGHSHGTLPDFGGKTFDVGVDCFSYYPASLEEVKAEMAARNLIPVYHHES